MNYKDLHERINPKRSIAWHHSKAAELAVSRTKELALKILRSHPNLKEFVMAMGTYFFVDNQGETVNCTEEYYTSMGYRWRISKRYFTPLVNHITKWDEIYKITGNPMRFTKNGKVTRDW